jgi:hypothetical protein
MPWRTLQLISGIAGIALTFALTFFLPDLVAIHFNISGEPDGWASKWINALLFCGMFLFLNVLYGGLPVLLKKIPVSLINIPNREYWFAPERKDASLVIVSTFLSELAFFTNFFIAGIELILFYANRTGKPAPSIVLFTLIGAMFAFIILWIVHFIKAFKLPKSKEK